jgi:hypothetical protein
MEIGQHRFFDFTSRWATTKMVRSPAMISFMSWTLAGRPIVSGKIANGNSTVWRTGSTGRSRRSPARGASGLPSPPLPAGASTIRRTRDRPDSGLAMAPRAGRLSPGRRAFLPRSDLERDDFALRLDFGFGLRIGLSG